MKWAKGWMRNFQTSCASLLLSTVLVEEPSASHSTCNNCTFIPVFNNILGIKLSLSIPQGFPNCGELAQAIMQAAINGEIPGIFVHRCKSAVRYSCSKTHVRILEVLSNFSDSMLLCLFLLRKSHPTVVVLNIHETHFQSRKQSGSRCCLPPASLVPVSTS